MTQLRVHAQADLGSIEDFEEEDPLAELVHSLKHLENLCNDALLSGHAAADAESQQERASILLRAKEELAYISEYVSELSAEIDKLMG